MEWTDGLNSWQIENYLAIKQMVDRGARLEALPQQSQDLYNWVNQHIKNVEYINQSLMIDDKIAKEQQKEQQKELMSNPSIEDMPVKIIVAMVVVFVLIIVIKKIRE